jgi:hypothetical protein
MAPAPARGDVRVAEVRAGEHLRHSDALTTGRRERPGGHGTGQAGRDDHGLITVGYLLDILDIPLCREITYANAHSAVTGE